MSTTLSSEQWLRRLEWALHPLPPAHRRDILLESRSHVEERVAQGQVEAEVLRLLGEPEDFARAFHEDFELSRSLGSRSLPRLIAVATNRLHRSAIVAGGFLLVCVLCLTAVGTALTAIMHFFDPANWGLWVSERMLLIGRIDPGEPARELIGAGIYPFAVLMVVACWSASRSILHRVLRGQLRASDRPPSIRSLP